MDTQFLELGNGKIAYDDTGRGPLVVCAPSIGDLRGEYRFLAPQLVAAGFRVVTMDLRGLGDSSPTWPDYSATSVGSDMLALVRSLSAGPAILVGTSMAASAAILAAAEAPELVAGLVLIGPAVHGEIKWPSTWLYRLLFAKPWGPALWIKYYKGLYPTRRPEDFEAYLSALQVNLKQASRIEAMRETVLALSHAAEERMADVQTASLVIMGTKDPDFKQPEAEARRVAGRLSGRVVMVPEAGHYPHAEMPEQTGPEITRFLQTLSIPEVASHAA